MFIVDAHLDLAYNALNFGRDLRRPVADLRQAEAGRQVGDGLITATFPSLRQAGVGLIFGTLFVTPYRKRQPGEKLVYRHAAEAHRLAMQQLDYYRRQADELDYLRLVGDPAGLETIVHSHTNGETPLLGIIPLMEGADPIREPEELELWYEQGLRIIGLAWDDTRYAGGAWQSGPSRGISRNGYRLMEIMADLGLILDITHLSEKASYEALERYPGTVVATHCNARALLPIERHLNDQQIRLLAERDGITGIVLYNAFLKPTYHKGDPKESVTRADVVAHIDHICQLLGDATHVGIGSDFDGGFGAQHIPAGLDSVLDLPNLATALQDHGYTPADIANIMGQNWLNLLRRALPAG